VLLQRVKSGQGDAGERTEGWDTVATVMASVEPVSGREFFAAQQANSEVSTRIRIRYRADVDAAWRVFYQGRPYNIQAVMDRRTEHRELELLCSLGVNDG
jgi:SPP1 family predicted phage head-tail adaptor